jgi:hypothetical protein
MISTQDREIQALVADIRDGKLLLPELQRSYVWKSTQVRDFFDSLYHQYPSGQLLVWETDDLPYTRTVPLGKAEKDGRSPQLLLDGQQRLTSLAAVMLGQEITAREKQINIVFNVYTEAFEVATAIHKRQPEWVSLAEFFTKHALAFLNTLHLDVAAPEAQQVLDCLQRLENIKTYKYRVNILEKLSYADVTRIFVRINSGGTRLGNADLALAQVSSSWRGITGELENYQAKIAKLGWELDTSLLLRAMTALLTNQSHLSLLFRSERHRATIEELQAAWERTKPALDQAINFIIHNCLIDRFSLMPTVSVLIPLVVFFDRFGTNVTAAQSRDLQRWLYMALIWSRYSGSAETSLDQDIAALGKEQPIQRMIENIENKVGRRPVSERELQGQLSNSPYMLMAYVLARRNMARDWFNGVVIGGAQNLEFHHIFPKARLRERYDLHQDYRLVNQVANLAFLSAKANGSISDQAPTDYLPGIDASHLRAQHVPTDRSLWEVERFEDFLRERRTMLADAINQLLQSLTDAPALWVSSEVELLETRINALEQQFRDLIEERLTTERGPLAWKTCVPADVQEEVRRHIEQRVRNHPSEADHYTTLGSHLENCLFSDYSKIIQHNWPMFQDAFGNKNVFDQHFGAVLRARNALKHNNELGRAERAVAEGGLIWLEDCLRYINTSGDDERTSSAGK